MTEYCYLLRVNHYYAGAGDPIGITTTIVKAKQLAKAYLMHEAVYEGAEWKGKMLSLQNGISEHQWTVCCDKVSKLVHISRLPLNDLEDYYKLDNPNQ